MGDSAITTDDTKLPEKEIIVSEDDKQKDTTSSTDAKEDYDIDKVDVEKLPPEIRAKIKGFQADYTKKTQKLAEEAKIHQNNVSWYDENEVLINEFNAWKQHKGDGAPAAAAEDEDNGTGENSGEDFSRALKKESKEIRERYDDMFQSGFGTVIDLMKLQKEHPDFDIDIKKVLTYAEKEGIADVNKAFSGAYGEDIFNKRLKEEVAKKEAEIKEKYSTQVMHTDLPIGRTQLSIKKPKIRA